MGALNSLFLHHLNEADEDNEADDTNHNTLDRSPNSGGVIGHGRDLGRDGGLSLSEGGHTHGETGGDELASSIHSV